MPALEGMGKFHGKWEATNGDIGILSVAIRDSLNRVLSCCA